MDNNIDMDSLLKKAQDMINKNQIPSDIKNMIGHVSSNSNIPDDNMSKLLNSLKPYLRDQKQEKVDEYIKLIKIGKAAQLFDIIGGDKK